MPTPKGAAPGRLFTFLLALHPVVGPIVAALLYFGMRFGVPALLTTGSADADSGHTVAQSIAAVVVAVSQKAAPLATIAVLFIWAFTLLHRAFDNSKTPPPPPAQ